MDLATIGLKADSTSIVKGTKDLDTFTGAAKRADAANNNIAKSSTKAAKATDQIGKSAISATKSFGLMKGVIGGLAFELAKIFAIPLIIKKFIDSTAEAEHVQSQLAAALRSTGGASGQTIASLNEQSKALQRITTFGDEAIGTAQGILLTFTKIGGDVFPKATTAVANLATRMGGDLQGAALQIGKALNAPLLGLTALSRAGIQFTEVQKEAIKTAVAHNDILKAQTIILKELETQFGGSAVAARQTLGGAITALGQAFGDLFELSGPATESLRAAIERVIVAITDPAFINFVNIIGTLLFTSIALVVQVLSTLAGILPVIANLLLPLAPLMLAAFGPQILLAVTTLGQAITVSLIGTIKSLFILLASNPFTAFLAAAVLVLSFMVDWQKAIKALTQLWALFVIAWNSFWENEAGVQRGIEIGLNADKAVADLTKTADDLKNKVFTGFDDGGDTAGGKVKAAMDAGGASAASQIGAAFKMDTASATAIWEDLNGKVIKPLGQTLLDGGKFIYNEATGGITKGSEDGAVKLATGVETGGQKAGQSIASSMTAAGGSIFQDLASLGDKWSNSLNGFLSDLIESQIVAQTNLIDAQTQVAVATAHKLNEEARQTATGRGGSGGGSGSGGTGTTHSGGVTTSLGHTAVPAPSTLFGGTVAPWEQSQLAAWQKDQQPSIGSFARGGSFRVPGTGGTDTKQVSFKATPGERVTIEPLGGTGGASKVELKVVNNFNPRDMLSAIGTSEGQHEFVNIIQANRDTIQAILGVT